MRMIAAGVALAFAAFTAAAYAAPVGAVAFSPEAQKAFTETYGERDAVRLGAYIQRALHEELAERGLANGALTVETTLLDAKPSRPTFQQLVDNVSLSMQSVSLGGAKLHARLVDSGGQVVDEVSYRWFEFDIRQSYSTATWTEARTAIRRFATKVADAYEARARV